MAAENEQAKNQLARNIARAAEEYYGEPVILSHAGWLTVNGKFLNMSSGHSPERDINHRDVRQILDRFNIELHDEPGSNLTTLVYFMDMGNIRLIPYGVDISVCPNEQQWGPLLRYMRSIGATSCIELSAPSLGSSIATLEYPVCDLGQVRNDLERFFDEGFIPEERRI